MIDRITVLNDPNNIAVKEQFRIWYQMYDKKDEYSDYELNEDSGMQMQ